MDKWTRITYHPNLPLGVDGRKVTASPEHIAISKAAALEGMVLLKNDGTLPLKRGSRVALFGKATFDYVKGGGGAGDVEVPYVHNLSDGMRQYPERVTVFPETDAYYSEYVRDQYAQGGISGMMDEPELPDGLVNRAAAFTDTAVISISRFSGEGWDRKSAFDKIEKHLGVWEHEVVRSNRYFPKGDFVLTDGEAAMVEKVKAAFDHVVVVLNVGGMFDTSWFKGDPRFSAALMGWQAGIGDNLPFIGGQIASGDGDLVYRAVLLYHIGVKFLHTRQNGLSDAGNEDVVPQCKRAAVLYQQSFIVK